MVVLFFVLLSLLTYLLGMTTRVIFFSGSGFYSDKCPGIHTLSFPNNVLGSSGCKSFLISLIPRNLCSLCYWMLLSLSDSISRGSIDYFLSLIVDAVILYFIFLFPTELNYTGFIGLFLFKEKPTWAILDLFININIGDGSVFWTVPEDCCSWAEIPFLLLFYISSKVVYFIFGF